MLSFWSRLLKHCSHIGQGLDLRSPSSEFVGSTHSQFRGTLLSPPRQSVHEPCCSFSLPISAATAPRPSPPASLLLLGLLVSGTLQLRSLASGQCPCRPPAAVLCSGGLLSRALVPGLLLQRRGSSASFRLCDLGVSVLPHGLSTAIDSIFSIVFV